MLGIIYCKCGSTEVSPSRSGEDGSQHLFCPDCGAEGRLEGFEVGSYFGAHASDVAIKSQPGRKFVHSEVEEWEKYPGETAEGEKNAPISPPNESVHSLRITRAGDARYLDPMHRFEVSESNITHEEIDELAARLDAGADEVELQAYLEKHPGILVQFLRGGHGRYVLPHPRLGSEYVPDFIIGERASYGYEWLLVELESPKRLLFTQGGRSAQYLRQAMGQIQDWRYWLTDNRDYACRPPDQNGLGLFDIEPNATGLIIIGRRRDLNPADNRRRRDYQCTNRMMIRTWDWLVEVARARTFKLPCDM